MITRTLFTACLLLVLNQGANADVQYGIEVGQSELGFMMVQFAMATNQELGRYGKSNFALAARYYRKAAVLGFPPAQNNIGRLYEQGRGVVQDFELAYVWYSLAARAGHQTARSNRDEIASRLPPGKLITAQKLLRRIQLILPR